MATEENEREVLSRAQSSSQSADEALKNYVSSVDQTMANIRQTKDKLDEVQAAAEDANAENAAAEATVQGIVSVSDALKLMDEEADAKAKYRKTASEYLSKTASALGTTIKEGSKVLAQQSSEFIDGIRDGALSGSGILALGGGALLGAVLPSAIEEPATEMLSSFLHLKDKNDTDVEEKAVDGYEDEESAANAVIEDNTQEGDGSSKPDDAKGEDAESDKDVPGDTGFTTEYTDDALNMSEEDKDKFSNIDEYISGLTEGLENSENPLFKAIGEGIDHAKDTEMGQTIVKGVAEAWTNLTAAADRDSKDNEPQDENEIDLYGK